MLAAIGRVICVCGIFGLGLSAAHTAYPDRTVHFIVGASPGGATDVQARLFAQQLSEKWGVPVLVENKIGADNAIAAEFVAHAAPDGYTLDVISGIHTIQPNIQKLPYDPVASFTPIIRLTEDPNVLVVNPSVLPVKDTKELIAYAKANPGKLSFSVPGPSSPPGIEMVQFSRLTGIKMVMIPYKGGGPSLIALAGGEVQLAFGSIQGAYSNIQSGRLKALAVSSHIRVPLLADVPTIEESAGLPDFDFANYTAVLGPAGMPKEITAKLNADFAEVLKSDAMKQPLFIRAIVPIPDSPEEFKQFLIDDIKRWGVLLEGVEVK